MLASVNLALLLIFFNLLGWDLSKCSQFVQFVLPIIWKPKKLGLQRQYPHYLQFCVFSSISNFGPTNFLKTGSRKDRNVFNDLANLGIFHRRKRNKYCSKDPYFLCCKILRNEIEVRQDLYLSVRSQYIHVFFSLGRNFNFMRAILIFLFVLFSNARRSMPSAENEST